MSFFTDDFETGNFSKTENGFYWSEQNTRPDDDLTVSSTVSLNGSNSARFFYAADASDGDGWSELRFELGRQVTEIWLKWNVLIPSNYYHRNVTPPNNKFFFFWSKEYGNSSNWGNCISSELWPHSDGDGSSTISYNPVDHSGHYGRGPKVIALSDRGKWVEFIMHFKIQSGSDTSDGIFELWKKTQGESRQKLYDYQNLNSTWGPDWTDWPDYNFLERGYLFGWSNSGFAENTAFYVDDVEFSETSLLDAETAYDRTLAETIDLESAIRHIINGNAERVLQEYLAIYDASPSTPQIKRQTDFSEYTTGLKPPDWTERWNTGDSDWTVQTGGSYGGRYLEWLSGSTTRRLITWDDVDPDEGSSILYRDDFGSSQVTGNQPSGWSRIWHDNAVVNVLNENVEGGGELQINITTPERFALSYDGIDASTTDQEILVLTQYTDTDGTDPRSYIHLRASGGSTTETSYMCFWDPANGSLNLAKYNAGAYTYLDGDGTDHGYALDDWLWVRFRVSGTTIQGRTWAYGDDEPEVWSVEVTDSDVTTGKPAIGAYRANNDQRYDYVGLATDGDSAPGPATATQADVEALALVNTTSTINDPPTLFLRASGEDGTEQGYFVTSPAGELRLYKYVAGDGTFIQSAAVTTTQNEWRWVRFRANSTTLQARAWALGDSEPGTWDIDTTDSSITTAGWAGLGAYEIDGYRRTDFYSIATGGESALFPLEAIVTRTLAAHAAVNDSDTHRSALSTRAITDDAALTVNLAKSLGVFNLISQSVSAYAGDVTDQVFTTATFERMVEEEFDVVGLVLSAPSLPRTLRDSVALSTLAYFTTARTRTVETTFDLSEALDVTLRWLREVNEQTAVTPSVARFVQATRELSGVVDIEATLRRWAERHRETVAEMGIFTAAFDLLQLDRSLAIYLAASTDQDPVANRARLLEASAEAAATVTQKVVQGRAVSTSVDTDERLAQEALSFHALNDLLDLYDLDVTEEEYNHLRNVILLYLDNF